jgi:hypothetical protein
MATRLTANTVAHPNPLPPGERERTVTAAKDEFHLWGPAFCPDRFKAA